MVASIVRSPLRREALWSLLICGGLAAYQWWPAFVDLQATGFGDWQMVHHNWEAARVALARHGEWPLWDPYHCGGITILGNPESQLYSPLFWLSFPLGSVLAVKVFLWLHISVGLWGSYLLARRHYRLSTLSAAVAAIGWGLSGCFAWDGAGGHATFLPFAFAPWIVLLWRRGLEHPRALVGLALLLLLSLLEGGTYPLPYFGLMLAFEWLLALALRRRPGVPTRAALLVMLLLLLGGAVRLIPVAMALRESPRTVESADSLSAGEALEMLTARSHGWRNPPHTYVWPEYGSYVGWPLLALAALGLLACAAGGPRHLLLGLLCFGGLMLGSGSPLHPWTLLHQLPVFDSLRVPSRFAIVFTFYLALLAAHGSEVLLRRLPAPRLVQTLLTLGLLYHSWDLVAVNREVIDRWKRAPLVLNERAERFHLVGGNYGQQYASNPARHLGTPGCYVGGMNWRVSRALWLGDRPQAKLREGSGRILSTRRSNNRMHIRAELQSEGLLVVNQNAAPGWHSSVGVLGEDKGRAALRLGPGTHHITLRYLPGTFVPSLLLSLLGLGLCAALLHPRLRSRWERLISGER